MRVNKSVTALCVLGCASFCALGANEPNAAAEIDAFNAQFTAAMKSMKNEAMMELWDDGGVTLLPNTAPIVGKVAIAKFLTESTSELRDAHMEQFDLRCFDIVVVQDWASEWCLEHQIVKIAAGKPPFDGHGNLLLILRRGADGHWRLSREMWNQGVAPSQ